MSEKRLLDRIRAATTVALTIILWALPPRANAELSLAQINALKTASGQTVYTSDLAVVGVTRNVLFERGTARLLVRVTAQSFFRSGSGDLIIITSPDQIRIEGDDIVLEANKTRMQLRADNASMDGSSAITIFLPRR